MSSIIEKLAASVEPSEKDEKRSGYVGSTISGDGVDSQRVEAAQLAAEDEYMRNNTRQRRNNLVSVPPEPPKNLKSLV